MRLIVLLRIKARTAITGYQHTLIARAAARSAHHAGAVPPLKGAGHGAVLHETVVAIQHYATAALHTAMAAGFDDTFMVATVLAAIGVVLAFTLRRQPVPPIPAAAESADERAVAA